MEDKNDKIEPRCPNCKSINTFPVGGVGFGSTGQDGKLPVTNNSIYMCADCNTCFNIYQKEIDQYLGRE